MKLRFFLIIVACFSPFLTAQNFVGGLSADERATLDAQDIVVRFINNTEKIAMPHGNSPQVDRVIDAMLAIQANYLAEAMWRVPVAGYEDLLEEVDALFSDMHTFKEILYCPEGSDTVTHLFTVADLVDATTDGAVTITSAQFKMDLFSEYRAELYQEKNDDSFVFLHKNTEYLHFAGIPMVKKERMRAGIALVRDGDYWFVYAAGGVRAPKPPLLRKSLERAFNNRIKDFASFYIKKVKR